MKRECSSTRQKCVEGSKTKKRMREKTATQKPEDKLGAYRQGNVNPDLKRVEILA